MSHLPSKYLYSKAIVPYPFKILGIAEEVQKSLIAQIRDD